MVLIPTFSTSQTLYAFTARFVNISPTGAVADCEFVDRGTDCLDNADTLVALAERKGKDGQ